MSESRAARGDRRLRRAADRARPRPRQHRQHQRAPRRRLADHADQLPPRPARSGAPRQARPGRPACRRRPALQGGVPAPRACTRCGRRAGAIVHLHSTHSVAVSCLAGLDAGRRAAAAHRLLRDADRQAAADALLPARRHRPGRRGRARSPPRMPRCCSPITARWSPARAWMPRSARSRSWRRPPSSTCCSQGRPVRPLDAAQVQELRELYPV